MNRLILNQGTFKSKYTELFNRGFRRGADERTAFGLAVSPDLKAPLNIPGPSAPLKGIELDAWEKGFEMGFRVGASDADLAGVDIPGAHGLISGFSEEFLEQFGSFSCEAA